MTHPRSNQFGVPTTISMQATLLRTLDIGSLSDTERIEAIRALEGLKNTACAVQARLAVDFDSSQRAAQREAGVPAARLGQGVAAQVALARRESPHRGHTLLGLAKALVHEMPHTLTALSEGVLSEYRTILITRETACLTREDRATVDRMASGDLERVGGLGNRELVAQAQRHAYGLDPHSVVRRHERAVQDRCVTLRPAPDGMSYLTALLPLQQGVACHAALKQAADTARATGDGRGRGQVMADTLTTRITGHDTADRQPVAVHLVMTDRALFTTDDTPAIVVDHGPIPAELARRLVEQADPLTSRIRRLYTDNGGQLTAMEAKTRRFPTGLATFVALRDQTCRTPWCDAPIRHTDHATPVEDGGQTTAPNGQGLCEACNHTKQAPGWGHVRAPGDSKAVTTPTRQRYPVVDPPPWPTSRPPG